MGFIVKQRNYDTIPDGQYRAMIYDFTRDSEKEPSISIAYEIVGDEYDGSMVAGRYRFELHERAALYKVAQAALKDHPDLYKEALNSDDLIGKEVLIDVITRTRAGDGEKYSTVRRVFPV